MRLATRREPFLNEEEEEEEARGGSAVCRASSGGGEGEAGHSSSSSSVIHEGRGLAEDILVFWVPREVGRGAGRRRGGGREGRGRGSVLLTVEGQLKHS